MCGIAGFINWHGQTAEELQRVAVSMGDSLRHRGPDDGGVWCDATAGLALAHRRLSILDLSPGGRQPMQSACGRYCLSYNGEIYNFQSIRNELESTGLRFRTTCDTEVLVEAIATWGLPDTLKRLIGMFAFALWDTRKRRLTLVRDAVGIKPLYYGCMGDCLMFASELKAMRRHPAFCARVDRISLAHYLRNGYLPARHSIYQDVRKLPPGTYLSVRAGDASHDSEPRSWWSLDDAVRRGMAEPFAGGEDNALAELDSRLRAAVKTRMKSDVPLGAFLSGGIDSSLIVANMQAESGRPVATFSIGFEEAGFDEAPHAKAVAAHLGTEHTEYYMTPQQARDVIPRLPTLYDEPFADPSQIPTFLVSQLARQSVSVCLSGDGGDELYGGYERYRTMQRLWPRVGWRPRIIRRAVSRSATALAGRLKEGRVLRRKLETLAELTLSNDRMEFYQRFWGHWHRPERLVRGLERDATEALLQYPSGFRMSYLEQMMHFDSASYLPDDILVKVDRASMAVALEVRVPMLDHRLVEFAWSLPASLRVRPEEPKWMLRRVLERYVPRSLFDRPKMGFGVPIGQWLRGPLRQWADDLLAPDRLKAEGYFEVAPIQKKWREHISGSYDWQYLLWDILMFQAWLDEQDISL